MNPSSYYEDSVKFLQKLIQTPSVNGNDSESAIVEVIAKEAKKLGLPYQIITKDAARPNIFIGEGFKDDQSLLLVAHLDTVPPGELKAWELDPFAATVKDSKLYGRGAFDCKGGIALSVYTLKMLADKGQLHKAKFVGVADEESGADSKLGLRYLLDQGLNAKAAVYTYGSSSNHTKITIGHRGLIRLWVTCKGEAAHSGSSEWSNRTKGESAIEGMTDFLTEIKSFTQSGKNKFFPEQKFTLTPTLIEGGSGESIVPDTAKVLLDIRLLPEHPNDEIIEKIAKISEKLSTSKRSFSMKVKNNIPGVITAPDSYFVQQAIKLNKEIFGTTPKLAGSGPANEGYMLVSHGIPTIMGYGPMGGNFHSANEYAELDSIESSLHFLAELAQED